MARTWDDPFANAQNAKTVFSRPSFKQYPDVRAAMTAPPPIDPQYLRTDPLSRAGRLAPQSMPQAQQAQSPPALAPMEQNYGTVSPTQRANPLLQEPFRGLPQRNGIGAGGGGGMAPARRGEVIQSFSGPQRPSGPALPSASMQTPNQAEIFMAARKNFDNMGTAEGAMASIMANDAAGARAKDLYNRKQNQLGWEEKDKDFGLKQQAQDTNQAHVMGDLDLRRNLQPHVIDELNARTGALSREQRLYDQAEKEGMSAGELLKIQSKEEQNRMNMQNRIIGILPDLARAYPDTPQAELFQIGQILYGDMLETDKQIQAGKRPVQTGGAEEKKEKTWLGFGPDKVTAAIPKKLEYVPRSE
jgi:hypothetical protein